MNNMSKKFSSNCCKVKYTHTHTEKISTYINSLMIELGVTSQKRAFGIIVDLKKSITMDRQTEKN